MIEFPHPATMTLKETWAVLDVKPKASIFIWKNTLQSVQPKVGVLRARQTDFLFIQLQMTAFAGCAFMIFVRCRLMRCSYLSTVVINPLCAAALGKS